MARIEQILDECVERLRRGETIEQCLASYPREAGELEPLLKTVATLQQVSDIRPRPEFRAYAKASILGSLRERSSRKAAARSLVWRRTFATVAVSIAAVFAVGAGTVAASADSLPGHPLYSVKRTVEKIQLATATSDVGKAKLLAEFANRRVQEIGAVVAEGHGDQVDAVSASAARDIERIPAAIGSRNDKPPADSGVAPVLRATTTTTTAGSKTSTTTSQPAPTTVGTLNTPTGGEQTGTPPSEQGGDGDAMRKASSPAEVRKALLQEEVRQKAYLEALLKSAPDKDKPAIQRAIDLVDKAYQEAAQAGGD